jgi:tRNA-dihydrouridine synthase
MKKNFLKILKEKKGKNKVIAALAPMADVTDFVFREMISKYSQNINENNLGPDIF